MNLPNKLTVLRVALIPIFLVFLLIPSIPYNLLFALAVFAVASLTDALDGHIARKHNLVTNFGKFLDPLADKALVMAALVGMVDLKLASSVAVIIIIAREFMVSGLRMVAASDVVIAAGIWGKLKTAFTMIAIVVILFLEGIGIHIGWLNEVLIWVSTALTVISGAQYLWGYRKFIDTTK